jgi:hypothetical protein
MADNAPQAAEVIAHCEKCGCGFVYVNWSNPDVCCHKCGGKIVPEEAEPKDKKQ